MITTCRRHVPLGWIIIACVPMVAIRYSEVLANSSMVFTLKKFVENPALITLILSIPWVLSFFVSPFVSFLSDRVWTRFGRRLPFLVVSWIGLAGCFILMPLMPNIWLVAVVYVVSDLFRSMYSTFEPLRNEIVPPPQRLRSAAVMEWFGSVTGTLFWFVVFGRFDDVAFTAGFPVTGEEAMYWAGALLLVVLAAVLLVGVREAEPTGDKRGERLSPRNIVRGLADRDLWPVYTLLFSSALLSAGLGPLNILVYTETFGFTKQDQGTNVVVGGLINMCIIGFLGWWAERMERIRAYQLLLGLSLVVKLAYYLYIEFVLPDQRASIIEAILFGEVLSIIMLLKGMIYYPLAYDYVIRNKMGTFQAGGEMIKRLTHIITVNMVGLFVTFYSWLLMAPAGEMTRVVLREPMGTAAVERLAAAAAEPGVRVDARPFRASGPLEDPAVAWEFRLDADEARRLAAERTALADRLRLLPEGGERALAAARHAVVEAGLEAKVAAFRAHIADGLAGHLADDADGVRGARAVAARVLSWPIDQLLTSAQAERILDRLHHSHPQAIDLRQEEAEGAPFLVLAVPADGMDARALGASLADALADSGCRLLAEAPAERSAAGIELDLRLVEEPVDDHPSPVTRAVNVVLAWFGAEPSPERRMDALARGLRSREVSPYVRARRGERPERSVVVTAVLAAAAHPAEPPPGDAVAGRLRGLLGEASVAAAHDVYRRALPAAEAQRLTVVRRCVASSYAPKKYDYMSGYLMMFALGLVGMWITIDFCRRERRGEIRKHGLEEGKELK